MALIEAATWGTTVPAAATAKLLDLSTNAGLVELTEAVERCLLAELPEAMDRLLTTLARRAALDADVVHLMEALPALARAQRYGDVRDTDTSALRPKSARPWWSGSVPALKPAVIGLDDDSARAMRHGWIGSTRRSSCCCRRSSEAVARQPRPGWFDRWPRLLVDRRADRARRSGRPHAVRRRAD